MPLIEETITEQPRDQIDIPCRVCTKMIMRVDGWNREAYPTVPEQAAFLNQVADAKGWGYGQDWIDGEYRAYYVCPSCLKTSPDAIERILPRFSPRSLCAACGNDSVSTVHCHGRIATCELGAPRDHLHRTCERCGNRWIEGRLDDPKAK